MPLDDDESRNIEDRRGASGLPRGIGGIGIGTIVVALAASWLFDIDPSVVQHDAYMLERTHVRAGSVHPWLSGTAHAIVPHRLFKRRHPQLHYLFQPELSKNGRAFPQRSSIIMATSRNIACLVALSLLLGACATTRFYPYEGKENSWPAKGGSRFSYEGIDVWFNGEPSRPYEILGYIEDPRGLYADANHQRVESGVIEKAREAGADALIETIQPGYMPSPGFAFGSGFGRPSYAWGMAYTPVWPDRPAAKYTAIRYLDKSKNSHP